MMGGVAVGRGDLCVHQNQGAEIFLARVSAANLQLRNEAKRLWFPLFSGNLRSMPFVNHPKAK